MLDQALRLRDHAGALREGIGVEDVGMTGELRLDVIFQQAMNQDHVAADQLLLPGHGLLGDLSVMGDELEIERRDQPAGVAFADRGLLDVTLPPAEGEIRTLDRVLQMRAVELRRDEIDEGRVPFELRQLEWRAERADDRIDQVGQDVLGVIELDPGEITGIAGDVGDDETCGFGLGQHGITDQLKRVDTHRGGTDGPSQSRPTEPRHSIVPRIVRTSIYAAEAAGFHFDRVKLSRREDWNLRSKLKGSTRSATAEMSR